MHTPILGHALNTMSGFSGEAQNCLLEDNLERLFPLRMLNADGAIRIKTPSGSFWASIEYERRKKSFEKYVKKLTDYYLQPEITAVFYICEKKEIEKIITNIDREIGHEFKAKIYTTMQENVISQNKKVPFKNSQGDVFNLK